MEIVLDTWKPKSDLKNASKLLKDYKSTHQVRSIVTTQCYDLRDGWFSFEET
ncbi:hypothetical protein HK096_001319, partial [Nowakowskiella sp. JEL0078]